MIIEGFDIIGNLIQPSYMGITAFPPP